MNWKLLSLVFLSACATKAPVVDLASAPVAATKVHVHSEHGVKRKDSYFWLRERENPEVLAHMNAEAAYAESFFKQNQKLVNTVFEEMKSRIQKDNRGVKTQYKNYLYWWEYKGNDEYARRYRQEIKTGKIDVLLDDNELAKGQAFTNMAGYEDLPEKGLLFFGVDHQGRNQFDIKMRDLKKNTISPPIFSNTNGSVVVSNDGQYLFFVKRDPQTLRDYQMYRWQIGSDPKTAKLIYEEKDETYSIGIAKDRLDKYIRLGISGTDSRELWQIPADQPTAPLKLFQKRRQGLEYTVQPWQDKFIVRTNLNAPNFKIMICDKDKTELKYCKSLIAEKKDTLLASSLVNEKFMVVESQKQARAMLEVFALSPKLKKIDEVAVADTAYDLSVIGDLDGNLDTFDYSYESLATPNRIYRYNPVSKVKEIMKEQVVVGGHEPSEYVSSREWVTARDGTKVPISIMYKKSTPPSKDSPLLMNAYASYGWSYWPAFSSNLKSLVDRGWVYVIAHARGGKELGRKWYDDGKLFKKRNSFNDVEDVGKYLVTKNYTSPRHLFLSGRSAGGLMVGATINQAPELFHGAIAGVPFVDVVTTMLDTSIPLTTGEFNEWGDPRKKKSFDYMLSYSPYDNVKKQRYPYLLVFTGFHDSQVQYWEPAKWVAQLRATKTDTRPIIFDVDMKSGHGGKSGRFEGVYETAKNYSWLLWANEQD